MKKRARKEPTQLLTQSTGTWLQAAWEARTAPMAPDAQARPLTADHVTGSPKEDRRQNRDTKNEPMRLPGWMGSRHSMLHLEPSRENPDRSL